MRVLLDEQLNWRLARAFRGDHDVRSVRGMGWTGVQNGDLLRAAQRAFDVLVTMDRNIEHQQHLPSAELAVILVVARSNRIEDTEGLVPAIERLLPTTEPGRLYVVGAPGGPGG